MRLSKVKYDSTINATAFVVECHYHNVSAPSLVVVSKKADEDVPTNYNALLKMVMANILSHPTSVSDDAGNELKLQRHSFEEYECNL